MDSSALNVLRLAAIAAPVAAFLSLAGAVPAAGEAAATPICDSSTDLTMIGMDTAAGSTLFSIAPAKDGVLTGTGLFSASGPPQTWVSGLPGITAERRGQLIALTGTSVAYVSGDGVVYLSENSGKAWRRSTWTPWGATETVGIWRQGKDYWVDFPSGDHRGSLRLVWFDRRRPAEQ